MPTAAEAWSPELVIYGGSFDPPHAAHTALLVSALREFPAARAWMVPAAATPLAGAAPGEAANSGSKVSGATYAQRFAMCELAVAALPRELMSRITISTLEAELPQPNYTVTTLREIRKRQPKTRLALLIGGDQLEAFSRWREPREILALASLIAVQRDGAKGDPKAVLSALDFAAPSQDGRPLIYSLDGQPVAAASRALRAAFARGDTAPEGWLERSVAHYIDREGLYR